jgi:nicotinamidase-related amidase
MPYPADDGDIRNPQLLLCVNMQKGQLAADPQRPRAHPGGALTACETLLSTWRSRMWPVAHLKRVAQAAWFGPMSELTDWLDGWRPVPGEMVFEHPLPSAYSSPRFSEYMRHIGPTTCTIIGFALEDTVLATVIDGFHRGHQLRVVEETVACREPGYCEPAIYRRVLLGLVENYASMPPLHSLLQPAIHRAH